MLLTEVDDWNLPTQGDTVVVYLHQFQCILLTVLFEHCHVALAASGKHTDQEKSVHAAVLVQALQCLLVVAGCRA